MRRQQRAQTWGGETSEDEDTGSIPKGIMMRYKVRDVDMERERGQEMEMERERERKE